MNQKTQNWNQGFTLSEIIMTAVIVGIVSTISLPPLLRIHMNYNMEAVKQDLRAIGEKLTEIMGRERQFPPKSHWGNGAVTEDELSLTANLNSIDTKGFTTEDYFTDAGQNNYAFRSCPKSSLFGEIDRCLLVDSFGVREIKPWEGMMLAMNNLYYEPVNAKTGLSQWEIFKNTYPGEKMLEYGPQVLEVVALNLDVLVTQIKANCSQSPGCSPSTLYSFYLPVPTGDKAAYMEVFERTYSELLKKGITVYQTEYTPSEAIEQAGFLSRMPLTRDLQKAPDSTVFGLAFAFDDPVNDNSELLERVSKIGICQKNPEKCIKK